MKKGLYLLLAIGAIYFLIKMMKNIGTPKTWDKVTDDRIQTLHPAIRSRVAQAINRFADRGIYYRVTSAFRSPSEQQSLYAQGRFAPGKVVTNAKPFESFHNYGLAFDFVKMDNKKTPNWGVSGFTPMADYFKKIPGWTWGGNWSSPDYPHLQYNPMNLPASQYVRRVSLGAKYPNIV
jgi:peptidoglycan L-alanyl-D-glutamate endopeptidase CwlK